MAVTNGSELIPRSGSCKGTTTTVENFSPPTTLLFSSTYSNFPSSQNRSIPQFLSIFHFDSRLIVCSGYFLVLTSVEGGNLPITLFSLRRFFHFHFIFSVISKFLSFFLCLFYFYFSSLANIPAFSLESSLDSSLALEGSFLSTCTSLSFSFPTLCT